MDDPLDDVEAEVIRPRTIILVALRGMHPAARLDYSRERRAEHSSFAGVFEPRRVQHVDCAHWQRTAKQSGPSGREAFSMRRPLRQRIKKAGRLAF
jgi:hypothetical protein